jgi:hypothetical protein
VTRRWTVVFLLVGLAALAYLIVDLGFGQLVDGVVRIGWGFLLSCLAFLSSLLFDAVVRQACAGKDGAAVGFWVYARAGLAGHAINTVTPLGQLGEITKYLILRERLTESAAASVLVVENLFAFWTNCALIGLAPPIAVLALGLHGTFATILLVAAGVFLLAGIASIVLLRRGPIESPFRLARRLGIKEAKVEAARAWWRRVENLSRSTAGDPRRMAIAGVAALLSRLATVGEVAIILYFLGFDSMAVSFLTLANNQLVFTIMPFVPMQAGTAEGGSYLLFAAAGMPPQIGVLMELVRKVRRLVFVTIGVALIGTQAFRQYATAPAAPGPAIAEEKV